MSLMERRRGSLMLDVVECSLLWQMLTAFQSCFGCLVTSSPPCFQGHKGITAFALDRDTPGLSVLEKTDQLLSCNV